MIAALISGTLFHDPETRMSKAGKPFATGILKIVDGDVATWPSDDIGSLDWLRDR